MSMLDGVSQCWWLSGTCGVNWNAWSAVGTLAAVVVALTLARSQSNRAAKDRRSRARWIALELRMVLAKWSRRVKVCCKADEVRLFYFVDEESPNNPFLIPPEIDALRPGLHELGDAAAPLADAIWVARQLSNMPITRALEGNLESAEEAEDLIEQFHFGLRSLDKYIDDAQTQISGITGLSAPDPANRTFGV